MAEKKHTVWQNLGHLFGPGGYDKERNLEKNQYNLGNQVLLKTQDKGEYDIEKLQKQQTKYLGQMWSRVDSEMFQQSLHYEVTRIGSYSNFESMEYFPEISAALDIFMEESCTLSNKGKMLNIYSNSKRIRQVLDDLFHNRLSIHTNLPMWIRNLCKFGDNMVFLAVDDERGIVGCRQLPIFEIERRDSDIFAAMTTGRDSMVDDYDKNGVDGKNTTTFHWRGRDIDFQSWQVAHFRLLGDDRRLPYGVSVLEKARRIWKQCVTENTKVWTETGYKKIKNITKDDIIYVYDYNNNATIKSGIKDCWKTGEKQVYNVRTRYNNISVTDNHPILIYDSKNYIYKTINEISPKKDYLVTPVIKDGLDTLTIKLDDEKYYIKLNDLGLKKAKSIPRMGIIQKLKSISDKDYKNIHRFIQGGGKIKYKHLSQLCDIFDFTLGDIDVFYCDTPTMLNKNLEITLNKEFFNFFGFMLGDGWLEKSGIGFALGVYDDVNQHYIDYITNNFNVNYRILQTKSNDTDASVHLHSIELRKIFETLGFVSEFNKKVIPDWVFNLNLENKREVIKGLFEADGAWDYGVIGLSNKRLITDLKELCNQSGLASGKIGVKPYTVKCNKKTGKTEVRQETYKLYINFNNVVDDVRHERVVDITNKGVEPVWDLTTESELHNFIGDGVVVHNCLLSEDAMMVYRVTRAPERRIYKIYVGNIDDQDVGPYVNEIANRFKRRPVIDPQTGQIDLRYNQLPVWKKTPIPLLDGRTISIEELAKEYDAGIENEVYSVQDDTNNIVSGKVVWCGKNYTADKMVKVWLDDDTYVVTAPEHPFVLRDGTKKRADELKVDDSLMPFYRKNGKVYNPHSNEYINIEQVLNSSITNKYEENNILKLEVVNHKVKSIEIVGGDDVYCMTVQGHNGENDRHNFATLSFNIDGSVNESGVFVANSNDQDFFIPVRDENAPSPIETLPGACISLDTKIPLLDGRTLELQEIIDEWDNNNRNLWVYSCNPETGEIAPGLITWAGITRRNTEVIKITLDNGKSIITTPDHKWVHRTKGFVEAQNLVVGDSLMPFYSRHKKIRPNTKKYEQVWDNKKSKWVFTHKLNNNFFDNIDATDELNHYNVELEANYNHKVINIEWLDDKQDTGTITVDGNEIYHNYHTFATESGVFIKNSNLDDIADIEYLQKKLCTALRVPKTFLGFEENVGEGKNLALQDIRFSRTINRIQQAVIMELNKIAIIHLYLLGFNDDMDNFVLTMNNPSTQADMLKTEHLQQKVTLYNEAVRDSGNGFSAMSLTRAKKEIFNWTDEEIKQDLLEQRIERAAAAEMEATSKIIKHTGIFDDIDRIYGDPNVDPKEVMGGEDDAGDAPGGAPGGFGGGGLPGEIGELGDLDGELGGDEETPNIDDVGDETPEIDFDDVGPTDESISHKNKKLIVEHKKMLREKLEKRKEKYKKLYFDKLVGAINNPDNTIQESVKITDKSLKINHDVNSMITEIDDLIDKKNLK